MATINQRLGGILENLSKTKAESYNIDGGVVVKTITSGGALARARMEEGFVITSVNGREVKNIEDLTKLITSNNVRLEGFYPGYDGTYTFPLNLNAE